LIAIPNNLNSPETALWSPQISSDVEKLIDFLEGGGAVFSNYNKFFPQFY